MSHLKLTLKLHLLTGLLSQLKSAMDTRPPTLGQLSTELKDVENWYLLGLQLNVSKDTLDSIEKLHETKMRQCIEMIQHWRNNFKNPTWETVHEALRNIGESALAAKIADKYDVRPSCSGEMSVVSKSESGEETLLAPQSEDPNSSSEERSLIPKSRDAAVVIRSKIIISKEQKRICSYFATVMDRITEILETLVKLEALLRFLRLHCHPLNPEMLYFDRHILHNTKSVSEVMESLVPDYINYMDTVLLEAIIERFEVKEAQKLLQGYHDRYPHSRQLSDMPDPIPDERLDQTRRQKLRAKCDGDFDSARACDVRRVQSSIEGATGIDHGFVTPAQHSEGSLIFTFLIPDSVSGIFQELCDEDLELLAEAGIVEVQINDFVLSDIHRYCPQRTRSTVQSTSLSGTCQSGITTKGYDTYIEQRSEPFTNKEKAHLTGLLKIVSKSKLEEVCSDAFLRQLVPHMRDWRKLVPGFGIGDIEAEELACRYQDVSEQRYRALCCWKQINPETSTYKELIACLLAHAPFDLTEAALMMLIPGKRMLHSLYRESVPCSVNKQMFVIAIVHQHFCCIVIIVLKLP